MGRRTPKNTSNLQTSLGTVGSADNAGLQVSKTGKKTKKAATTVVPADHTSAEGTPRQATTSKSASRTVKPSSMPSAFRRPSVQGKKHNSASLAAASTSAKPPVLTQPARPRKRPASAQANPASRQCRWASLFQGSAGHSRVASRQCRYSRDRSRGPVPAAPLVRATEASPKRAPRGPRADLNDQKLFTARPWPPVSNFLSTPLRRATRATQEPLEPLTPAPAHSLSLPPQCAFCGQLHLSRECNVYATVSQRLNRIRQFGRCLSCLGQDHRSSSCLKTDAKCRLCRTGQHHEALCRRAAAPCLTTTPSTPSRAPTIPATANMRRSCAFCQSSHWSTNCTAYTSVTQRLNRVRNLKLCFVCLQNGHHATSCPSDAKLCKFCSTGSHHRSLCRRATKQSTDIRANGTHQVKKRVNTADVLLNVRNVCPPKNETICFCDASTFHQFGRQLRPEVQMIETPMFTSADASSFVCGYCPTAEVKRVIFWFSSDQASLSHAELVRLVTELSHYYATHFETIMQYAVAPSSVSSRQDVWAYGIFKYLVPAEVFLLPDTQTTMPAHDLRAQDANNQQAVVESVKHRLREEHQLEEENK